MKQLETLFEQNDLVWAKILNYPWWPGKIVQIFEQKKSLIFKISFYADPTYCYLKENDLIPFQDFQQKLNASFQIDSQLRKAIDLANNVYLRKTQILEKISNSQNKKTVIENQTLIYGSEMIEEQPEKGEQFQQSTIHVDYQTQSLNGKVQKQPTVNQIKQLLSKYKLDRIPKMQRTEIAEMNNQIEQQIKSQLAQSEDEQKVDLYDLKNTLKGKPVSKRCKRKFIVKRRKVSSLTCQQRRIQFMKRFCTILIQKGFDSSMSRQITLKIVEKIDKIIIKLALLQKQKISLEEVYLKIITMVISKGLSQTYDEKLLQIFRSVEVILYEYGRNEKEEEEKTNISYVQQQSLEALC